jgi:hypothetical protein
MRIKMIVIKKQKGFELQQIGSNYFQVLDCHGDSWGYKDSLKKAENLFKRILSNYQSNKRQKLEPCLIGG